MRDAADSMARRADGLHDDLAGTVRVSASEVIATEYLPWALSELSREHPQLVLELVSSNAAQDLTRREADIAIRMFEPRQLDLVKRRVTQFELAFYASRAYLDARGAPSNAAALLQHRLIGYDTELDHLLAARAAGLPVRPEHFLVRTDSRLVQINAVRAGLGIGVIQRRLAGRYPELIRVDLDLSLPPLSLYVVTHAELRTSRRMQIVFDALVRWFEALPALD